MVRFYTSLFVAQSDTVIRKWYTQPSAHMLSIFVISSLIQMGMCSCFAET